MIGGCFASISENFLADQKPRRRLKWNNGSTQAIYGFGTVEEADKYSAILNRKREVNVYGYRTLSEDESSGLESGSDTSGIRLDLELDAQAEQDAWPADRA